MDENTRVAVTRVVVDLAVLRSRLWGLRSRVAPSGRERVLVDRAREEVEEARELVEELLRGL